MYHFPLNNEWKWVPHTWKWNSWLTPGCFEMHLLQFLLFIQEVDGKLGGFGEGLVKQSMTKVGGVFLLWVIHMFSRCGSCVRLTSWAVSTTRSRSGFCEDALNGVPLKSRTHFWGSCACVEVQMFCQTHLKGFQPVLTEPGPDWCDGSNLRCRIPTTEFVFHGSIGSC